MVSVEDSKARVLVAISLKTYTQTTPAPTSSRPVGYEWMAILAPPPVLPLSTVVVVAAAEAAAVAVAAIAVDSTQSPVNRSWSGMYVFSSEISLLSLTGF